jgi:hypothetical protein
MNLLWEAAQSLLILARPSTVMAKIVFLDDPADDLLSQSLQIAVLPHWELIREEASVSLLLYAVS